MAPSTLSAAVVLLAVATPTTVALPRLEPTPAYVRGYCARSPRLLRACPTVLPRMSQPSPHWEASACVAGRSGCLGTRFDVLDLVDAGYGNRPPVWSHVAIYAGDLAGAFPFVYPTQGRPPAHLDGLFAASRARAVFVGTYRWGGRAGSVVLAPGYPAGGQQGDHLIFRWRRHGVGFAVGLHAWEPLTRAMTVLEAMIESIRGA
jgi:hypothetical protein